MELLEAEDYILCLSDDYGNFRKSLLPTYKEKRQKVKRPLVLKEVKSWMMEEKDAIIYPGLEGDDVQGIIATSPLGEVYKEEEYEDIIVSLDKDMKTIPAKVFRNLDEGLLDISEEEANYQHFYQTLMGDATDGYAGCPGIGAVKAKKALDENCSWDTVVSLFNKAGLTESDALVQARMARILRYEDWSYPDMKVKLWEPN